MTLTSTLLGYVPYDLSRSSATVKAIHVDNAYLKFEGSVPILIIDRANYWGYTTNTVIASNFASGRNIYCTSNFYLKINSKLYLDDLETQYITTSQLMNISGSTSNLQTQINSLLNVSAFEITTTSLLNIINTKPNITDINTSLNSKLNIIDAYTSSTINSLLN